MMNLGRRPGLFPGPRAKGEGQADTEKLRGKCKELEGRLEEMEKALKARREEADRVKKELEEKVAALQGGLQEVERKQVEMAKARQNEIARLLEEVRRQLEVVEKTRADSLAHLHLKMDEKHRTISRLHEEAKAALANVSQALASSYT